MNASTPETSDLRNRLAEAMQNHDWRAGDGNEYGLTSRHANHRFHWLCAVCEGDTERIAQALLPVVAQEIAAAEQRGRDEVRARVEAAMADPEFHIEVALGGSDYVRTALRVALAEPAAEEHP